MTRLVLTLTIIVVAVLSFGAILSHRMRARAVAEAASARDELRRAEARRASDTRRDDDVAVSILDGLSIRVELPQPGRVPAPIVFVRIEKDPDRAYEVSGLDGHAVLFANGVPFESLDRDPSAADAPLSLPVSLGHASFGFPLHEEPADGVALELEWTHVNPRTGEVERLRSDPVTYRRGPREEAQK